MGTRPGAQWAGALLGVPNLCLILLANPEASFVAGFQGLAGTRLLRAQRPTRDPDLRSHADQVEPTNAEETEQTRLLFRVVPAFARSQVESLDGRNQAPLQPPSEPLTGDRHAHLLTPASELACQLG